MLNLQNQITLLIAIFSFLLSLWNFFEPKFKNRCNIQIECKDFITAPHLVHENKIPMYLSLCINNKAALPVSISRIILTINNQPFEITWIPQVVHRSRLTCNNAILDSTVVKTVPFPVQIPATNLVSGYFCTFIDSTFSDEYLLQANCTITLHTNRKTQTFICVLPHIAHDI